MGPGARPKPTATPRSRSKSSAASPATPGILPVVLGGAGQALDGDRERRLATRAQRVAQRAMYPTCVMDPDPDPGSSRRVGHPHHGKGTVLPERTVWRTTSTAPSRRPTDQPRDLHT